MNGARDADRSSAVVSRLEVMVITDRVVTATSYLNRVLRYEVGLLRPPRGTCMRRPEDI